MIDIIMPVYNNEKHLQAALNSVLGQTCQDYSLIIVNDGSTDGSEWIIERYRQNFQERLNYIRQENKGPASARNTAIRAGNGEFIAFLDADDIWEDEKLAKQIAALQSDPKAGFVYTDNDFIDESGAIIENYIRKVKMVRGNVLLDLFCDHFLMTPAVMMRRACLERVGLFNEDLKVGEDYDFFLRLAAAYPAEAIQEKLWKRKVIADSLSRQDHVFDAQVDLHTLEGFIKGHPRFFAENKGPVKDRLANYHFEQAYRLLERGSNGPAFKNLLCSLKYKITLKAVKNLMLCCLPFSWRVQLKERHV